MLTERLDAEELMDDPALDTDIYDAVLADLARVNRMTMAARPTLAFLDRAIGNRKSFTLLDVGFGQGDMLRTIAKWAKKRGIVADLVGVDLNPRSEAIARTQTSTDMPIRYVTRDYAGFAGERFDFIVSSLVAHHMSDPQLQSFLRFMDVEAQTGWFINDLHRHGLSYLGYPWLARLMRAHPIVRLDGQMSIARSFRREEWREMLTRAQITHAEVRRYFPFRLCISKVR